MGAAAPAVPKLAALLDSAYDGMRDAAAGALWKIAPSVENDVPTMRYPALTQALSVWRNAQKSLAAAHSDNAPGAMALQDAKEAVDRLVNALETKRQSYYLERFEEWAANHNKLAGFGAYLLLVFGINGLLLAVWPIELLRINEGLKIVTKVPTPDGLKEVGLMPAYLLGVGFLNYHPRVLDAWVKKHAAKAGEQLAGRDTFDDRSAYVPVPIDFPDGTKPPTSAAFQERMNDARTVIVICGDGGSGKTTLACQMARWAIAGKPEERLCKTRRMMPVFLEANLPGAKAGDGAVLLSKIQSEIRVLTSEKDAPSDDLVKNLLRQRRILLIVDGYSELDEGTQAAVSPNSSPLPLNALLVTSRDARSLNAANPLTLKVGLLKGAGIAAFIQDYIRASEAEEQKKNPQAAPPVDFTDAAFYSKLHRFTEFIAGREITALLAEFYALYMTGSQKRAGVPAPDSIPALMDNYLDERSARVAKPPFDRSLVPDLAYKIAWNCLQDTLRPLPAPVKKVTDALMKTDDGIALPAKMSDATDLITYFTTDLRLLQRAGPSDSELKFTLDPLSEYLAARYLVKWGFKKNVAQWWEFLDDDKLQAANAPAIAGFLRALADTVEAKGSEGPVPDFVLPKLKDLLATIPPATAAQTAVPPPNPPAAPTHAVVATAAPQKV